jgi:hypothetical protein
VNFLLTKWVFQVSTVSNFRYFRMTAASDLCCVLIAEGFLVAGKGERGPCVLDLATGSALDLSHWLKRRLNRGKDEVA